MPHPHAPELPNVERRGGDRRVRQVYHDVERRAQPDRRVPAPSAAAREQPGRLGLFAWSAIALVALLLVDTFLWQNHYLRKTAVAAGTEAAAVREWSNNAWMAVGV